MEGNSVSRWNPRVQHADRFIFKEECVVLRSDDQCIKLIRPFLLVRHERHSISVDAPARISWRQPFRTRRLHLEESERATLGHTGLVSEIVRISPPSKRGPSSRTKTG